jgi:branched-chain amino acid transport system substrate-binding protein
MKQSQLSFIGKALLLLAVLVLLPACSGPSQGSAPSAPKEILIGASLPESGALAGFGVYLKWSYTTAINEVNKAGGLYLSQYKTKVPVRLIIYDDQSLPQQATTNMQRLILQDRVNTLLGDPSPPLLLAAAAVAERERIPLVGIAPIRAFLGARQSWSYSWDVFFDELNMTQQQYLTMNTVNSNHRVALFTDNEQDGVVMGGLWTQNAAKFGYTIAYHANFPVGTTDYGDLIRRAQAANAQIVIAQMVTPDAIALWRQMQALNYRPAAAFLEKAAEPVQWWAAQGKTAQGVMVAGYWDPSLPYSGSASLRQRFEQETGQTYSEIIAPAYADTQLLMDAIQSAGTLDPQAINAAIGKTNKTYVVGPVDFATGPGGHTSTLPSFMLQWQNGQEQAIYPSRQATAKLIYPLPSWSAVAS